MVYPKIPFPSRFNVFFLNTNVQLNQCTGKNEDFNCIGTSSHFIFFLIGLKTDFLEIYIWKMTPFPIAIPHEG